MPEKEVFTIDFTDFEKKFGHAVEVIPKIAEKALFEAGAELKHDADEVIPKTPHLHGDLKGEYEIKPFMLGGSLAVEITFRMPYAAWLHETPKGWHWNIAGWTEPGSGPKYLESKMIIYGKKYFQMVADAIKDGGR